MKHCINFSEPQPPCDIYNPKLSLGIWSWGLFLCKNQQQQQKNKTIKWHQKRRYCFPERNFCWLISRVQQKEHQSDWWRPKFVSGSDLYCLPRERSTILWSTYVALLVFLRCSKDVLAWRQQARTPERANQLGTENPCCAFWSNNYLGVFSINSFIQTAWNLVHKNSIPKGHMNTELLSDQE